MKWQAFREAYHSDICTKVLRIRKDAKKGDYPNNADGDSKISAKIAWEIVKQICPNPNYGTLAGQKAGMLFQDVTLAFLKSAFEQLQHVRPGQWLYSVNTAISEFEQYRDLARIQKIVKANPDLATSLRADYIISPDIVIGRQPISDAEINRKTELLREKDDIAKLTPLRAANAESPKALLHASISCKWTLRSDRAQNSRTEALNLIRNRKGKLPHIVAVTAEPTATRIASLALGTGDIDCVYHFALNELQRAIANIGDESQMDMLNMLIDGRRLRDISDLPFDLAA